MFPMLSWHRSDGLTPPYSFFEVIRLIKRMLCLLAACFFMVPSIGLAEGTNLLTNPGFEDLDAEGLPFGWDTDAYITREGVTLYSVTEEALTGQSAAVVENCDMNDARFAQTVSVKPNTMYRLSGWIKASGIGDAGHGANLSVEGVHARSESLYDTNGEWVYVETYGLTDDDQTEVTVFARVGGYSGESQGMAAFDDLCLEVVTDLPAGVYAQAWFTVQSVPAIDSVAEESDAAEAFWPWLIVLAALYAAAALWLMRHFQLDRREEAMREAANRGKRNGLPWFALIGLALSFLLRLIIALNVEGYQVDVNCFTAWGNTMSSVGPTLFYQSNWCDYTPGYLYVMGLNGTVVKLLNGLVSASVVHKLVPMLCDLVGAWLIGRLASEHGYSRRQAGLLALLTALNPAVILNSAAWCQIDSVLCVALMLVAYFAIHRKWLVVLPLYVLSALIKPQALMVGFLGLAAIIMAFMQLSSAEEKRKMGRELLIGLGISLVLALVIVLPFCPNQESPLWLLELYGNTMGSYPYATVNTANLYYLANANWDGLANPANPFVCGFFVLLSLVCSGYYALRQRPRKMKAWFAEPALMAAYTIVYAVLWIVGCTWTTLGVCAMSMAFALVLPMFIRSGKLENLPLCGAVLFILLYVLGIKMHERYLFPALFLLGMAYAIRRDRRILTLLIATSCTVFINEGIVLDNSIRLGSSMGHLNADTRTLAMLLSMVNVAAACLSIWVCHGVCMEDTPVRLTEHLAESTSAPAYEKSPCTPLNFKPDVRLNLTRKDVLLMAVVTAVYAVVTLTTLGSTKAPQNPWKSTTKNEYVYIDLGQHYDDFSMLYFAQVSYSNFAVSVSDTLDEDAFTTEYPAEMREGMCFSWEYLDPSYESTSGTQFISASEFANVQKLSGRYVRIDPKQVGLILNEVIFRDADGAQITGAKVVRRDNANEASPLYTEASALLDEQDTLDGEPSWWNSTYFDEIYHARTAFEHLNGTTAYEWTHPPLGKIIMSWCIGLFGMTPFGWRFAGAMCGVVMLPVIYLLAKQLTKRRSMAFMAMMLMALDCMHFTQTRLATIDSYPVLFIMLSFLFMLRFMQRDIVLEDIRKLLPDLGLSGFFMGCAVASKWIGVYAGIGLAVLYFWTCLRHLRMLHQSKALLKDGTARTPEELAILNKRADTSFRRIVMLCLWCLLFFVAIPVAIYLWAYSIHYAYLHLTSFKAFIKQVIQCQESMLSYHGKPGLGMDHAFYSPWYEWPLMMKPMYYASAAFKPEGKTYAIFCFGNPWVWLIGLGGIAYTVVKWARGHRYSLAGHDGTLRLARQDWDVAPAFLIIGLLAQFLPWVLVPRGTYIYHYFASVPFLILGTTLMLDGITRRWPKEGKWICLGYLALCLIWFILLFPYASGLPTAEGWMDAIRDYPYISTMIPNYWQNSFLVKLNSILEAIPIFPNVYHH